MLKMKSGKDGLVELLDGQIIDTRWNVDQIEQNCKVVNYDERLFSGRKFVNIHVDKHEMCWLYLSNDEKKITAIIVFDKYLNESKIWKRSWYN